MISHASRAPRMLPCPHCASDDVAAIVVEHQPMTTWAVRCSECLATGPRSTADDPVQAINAWNQRQGRLTVVK